MKRISLGASMLTLVMISQVAADLFEPLGAQNFVRQLGVGLGQGYHSTPVHPHLRPHYRRVHRPAARPVVPPPIYPAAPVAPTAAADAMRRYGTSTPSNRAYGTEPQSTDTGSWPDQPWPSPATPPRAEITTRPGPPPRWNNPNHPQPFAAERPRAEAPRGDSRFGGSAAPYDSFPTAPTEPPDMAADLPPAEVFTFENASPADSPSLTDDALVTQPTSPMDIETQPVDVPKFLVGPQSPLPHAGETVEVEPTESSVPRLPVVDYGVPSDAGDPDEVAPMPEINSLPGADSFSEMTTDADLIADDQRGSEWEDDRLDDTLGPTESHFDEMTTPTMDPTPASDDMFVDTADPTPASDDVFVDAADPTPASDDMFVDAADPEGLADNWSLEPPEPQPNGEAVPELDQPVRTDPPTVDDLYHRGPPVEELADDSPLQPIPLTGPASADRPADSLRIFPPAFDPPMGDHPPATPSANPPVSPPASAPDEPAVHRPLPPTPSPAGGRRPMRIRPYATPEVWW